MDMLMWGPAYDYELEYKRERLSAIWGRPAWLRSRAERRAARLDAASRPASSEPARATARPSERQWALQGSGAWPAR
jgi:hypothetical protein